MKELGIFLCLIPTLLFAIEGHFLSKCTHTNIDNEQIGFTTESYRFDKDHNFEYIFNWYSDSKCRKKIIKTSTQNGIIKIGKVNSNNMNPMGTLNCDFQFNNKIDKGLIWISKDLKKIRVARQIDKNKRNELLSPFELTKTE
ncbi:MAG: hypothetical protein N4A33_04580 [Bacteriovoracaceae bacterium]|jgi:hypothetical protein|nr:hypothetical protein [Bacteriovoracaceae bacterium]